MNDGPEKNVETLLETLRDQLESIPEPTLEELEAYARDTLSETRKKEIERVLATRPDLALEAEALRNPDPALKDAIWRGFEKGLEARESRKGSLWDRLLAWLGIRDPGPGASAAFPLRPLLAGATVLLVAVALVVALPPLLEHGPAGPGSLSIPFQIGEGQQTRAITGVEPVPVYAGESLFVEVNLEPPFTHAYLVNVSPTRVELIYKGSPPPGETKLLELGTQAEKSPAEPEFLVLVDTSEDLPGDAVRNRISRALKAGEVRFDQKTGVREAGLEKALRTITSGDLRVRVSRRFIAGGL